MKTQLSNFTFTLSGHGHYKVKFISPKTGKKWTTITSDMSLIDCTKNADEAKQTDLEVLKRLCKDG